MVIVASQVAPNASLTSTISVLTKYDYTLRLSKSLNQHTFIVAAALRITWFAARAFYPWFYRWFYPCSRLDHTFKRTNLRTDMMMTVVRYIGRLIKRTIIVTPTEKGLTFDAQTGSVATTIKTGITISAFIGNA
jgi:hypothetical protein